MYKQVQHILHGHPSPQSIILPTPATLPVMDRICALASGQIATSLGVSSDSDERRLLCSAVARAWRGGAGKAKTGSAAGRLVGGCWWVTQESSIHIWFLIGQAIIHSKRRNMWDTWQNSHWPM